MTDEVKALVQRLRGDWPEILVEKHWMMDSDAIDKQREEAADLIEELDRHLTLSGKVSKALSERIEALEAALRDLVEAVHRRTIDLGGYDGRFGLNKSITKARAALGEKQ